MDISIKKSIMENVKRKTADVYNLADILMGEQEVIENVFGLRLTNIEKFNLKKINLEVFHDRDRQKEAINYDFMRIQVELFQPDIESIVRFMTTYYGLSFELAMLCTTCPEKEAINFYNSNPQGFRDHLRSIQDREHHFSNY